MYCEFLQAILAILTPLLVNSNLHPLSSQSVFSLPALGTMPTPRRKTVFSPREPRWAAGGGIRSTTKEAQDLVGHSC